MTSPFSRGFLSLVLMCFSASLTPGSGFAQTNGTQTVLPQLHLPLSLEWNGLLDPHSSNRMATEGFKFQGGTKNLKMKFSTQAPTILGGKQFQWMPGGYQLSEFSLSRRWGSIQGFRSLRYNSRIVNPGLARVISGAGVEVPKSPLGTRFSAYFLRAAPTPESRLAQGTTLLGSSGSQIGITIARDLRKGAKVEAEWTLTQHDFRFPPQVRPGDFAGGPRRGLMTRFEGVLAHISLGSTFIARDEGLVNPAAPAFGPGQRNLRLDARRKWKGHEFQYSAQSDQQASSAFLSFPMSGFGEHIATWTYASKRLPQISASHTWHREAAGGKQEAERGYRLSAARSVSRIYASLTLQHIERVDALAANPLWRRRLISGDATIEIHKRHPLHLRYETSTVLQPVVRQHVTISSLYLDTRVNLFRERLSLVPVFDLRRQCTSSPISTQSAARFSLTAQIKGPRRIPGTDFVVTLNANHIRSTGLPDWNRVDLLVRWNFRRF